MLHADVLPATTLTRTALLPMPAQHALSFDYMQVPHVVKKKGANKKIFLLAGVFFTGALAGPHAD
jgi:hypothetical protein